MESKVSRDRYHPYADIAYRSRADCSDSDVLTPINSGGIYVSGYLQRANITKQPFAPENIVVVHDGYCASTCTIFSELMTAQGGVKTIALGGRPNKDIIQAVGGVKGTNVRSQITNIIQSELMVRTFRTSHTATSSIP